MPLERLDNIVPLKFGFGLTQVSACGKEIMCQLPLHRLEVERHVFKVEDTVTAQDYQSFDHVLQLAHIPWPMIMGEERQRLCCNALHLASKGFVVLYEEVIDEEWDIFTAVAQRWHMHWDHIETIKQVITEQAVGRHLLEILIRSSDNPHIRANGFPAPHAFKFTLLEDAQQFGLQIEAQTPHLVEKQCPR